LHAVLFLYYYTTSVDSTPDVSRQATHIYSDIQGGQKTGTLCFVRLNFIKY